MRCERGSVGVVLPASSRFKPSRTEDTGMRIIGLDIHRAFAEAVAWENGNLSRLGRVIMRREPLEEFAKQLSSRDVVVIEATGNAASVAAVIGPHVSRVVIANPKQVRLIAHAKIKTDKIGAGVLAQLYACGFLPEVWIADETTQALRSPSDGVTRLCDSACGWGQSFSCRTSPLDSAELVVQMQRCHRNGNVGNG